jgi:hypothetical protein
MTFLIDLNQAQPPMQSSPVLEGTSIFEGETAQADVKAILPPPSPRQNMSDSSFGLRSMSLGDQRLTRCRITSTLPVNSGVNETPNPGG